MKKMMYLLLGAAWLASVPAAAAPRPNVVVILADDMGWADVGYHGSEIKTPHIDRLAQHGMVFDQFYVQPTCTPTRVALMTGRYPFRTGAHHCVLRPYHKHGIPLDERFISEMFKDAGYKTAITGKWHLGLARKAYWPTRRGFDLQYGHLGGAINYFDHTGYGSLDWQDNDHHPLREEGYATDLIGARASQVIADHAFEDQPLFLYVPFNAPHLPLEAKPEDVELYAHIKDKKRRTYAAMVHAMDVQIGRIAEALEDRGVSDDTLILFASDNGGHTSGASSLPLRGHKGTLFEGGVRVPAFIVWPDKIAGGGTFGEPIHIVDMLPTLAHLAGGDPAAGKPLDGINVWPALAGDAELPERDLLHNVIAPNGRGAIRSGKWKLVVNILKRVDDGVVLSNPKLAAALFDLEKDPYEKVNLAAENPELVQELWDKLKSFGPEVGDNKPYCAPKPEDWVAPADWSDVPE